MGKENRLTPEQIEIVDSYVEKNFQEFRRPTELLSFLSIDIRSLLTEQELKKMGVLAADNNTSVHHLTSCILAGYIEAYEHLIGPINVERPALATGGKKPQRCIPVKYAGGDKYNLVVGLPCYQKLRYLAHTEKMSLKTYIDNNTPADLRNEHKRYEAAKHLETLIQDYECVNDEITPGLIASVPGGPGRYER